MSASALYSFLRRVGIASVVVAVLAVGVVTFGNRARKHEFDKRHVIPIAHGLLAPVAPAQPANYLLIGHDATGHSDTMMIVHVDPAVPRPLLVSFPRDLMVQIPGHGRDQLNAAITDGGIPLLIETFKTDFNVPISHFLQVDFSSFPQMVRAIGGHVKVWFPTPVHDPFVGLDVEETGCVSLDPQMALAYARSRHYYVPDDLTNPVPWQWNYSSSTGGQGWNAYDGGRDIERIPRQQYFLRTLAQAAINRTSDNPLKLFDLVPAVMSHLTTDQNLTLAELKSLVNTFRKVQPAAVEMTTIPWMTDPANHDRVVLDSSKAETLLFRLADFQALKPFLPSLVDPSTVRIRVVNGSGIPGLGDKALTQLRGAGFASNGASVDADRSDFAHTQVRWAPDQEVKGVTVAYATAAKQSGQAIKAADTLGADVLVVVGRDWDTLPHHLTGLPTSARTTTTPSTSTTIATPGTSIAPSLANYEPVDPKTHGTLVGCPKA
jgi:polyisoprenyl-teichoic acid--peptidoglycan teichoic acid transferase